MRNEFPKILRKTVYKNRQPVIRAVSSTLWESVCLRLLPPTHLFQEEQGILARVIHTKAAKTYSDPASKYATWPE